VPPIAETGLPNFDALAWIAVVAPARTSSTIVQKLSNEIADIVTTPEFRAFLLKNASTVLDISTPEQTAEFFKLEVATWGDIVRAAGLAGTQ
jgi:tripartite-type tricarboxylate transporter receptor subunit TctC